MDAGKIIIGILVTVFCPLSVHGLVYSTIRDNQRNWLQLLFSTLKQIVIGVIKCFSPDLISAAVHKNNLKLTSNNACQITRIELKYFITYSNYSNLFVSFLMAVAPLAFSDNINALQTIQYILGFRIISRCLEIIFSFGKDVITKSDVNKSSALDKFDRLQLALLSLLEICLLSAAIYAVINVETCPLQMFNSLLYSLGTSLIVAVNLKGQDGLILFSSPSNALFNFFVILQSLTSVTLIVLAVAGYLSDGNKQTETVCLSSTNFFQGDGDGI